MNARRFVLHLFKNIPGESPGTGGGGSAPFVRSGRAGQRVVGQDDVAQTLVEDMGVDLGR